ncbi:MAG: protein kinase, partial [Myxococcales bacterium]|nr:protein kinase [Myxococcales bacterium]
MGETWSEPTAPGAAALPGRAAPEQGTIADGCEELLSRVVGGGLAPAPPRAPAPELSGRYRLLHRLGSGGMGEVWRARHVGIDKPVAIKFLRRDLGADARVRQRFLREGRLAAAVEHPGVVDITDVGETEDGRAYLVMELLEGRTLAEEVRGSGPMAWPRARAVLEQLAEALACAHARGVVHRDLKPSNVMLVERPGQPERCVLIDFGMARATLVQDGVTPLTATGQVLGSPAYMSPEQFRGEPVDARSDVYSLGCLAFFLLAGRRPFDGTSAPELMYQHLMTPLPRLPETEPPPRAAAIERLLRTACHKEPRLRYPSMEAMRLALRGVDEPVPQRWRARVRRSAPVVAAGAVGLVAVLGVWWDRASGGAEGPSDAASPGPGGSGLAGLGPGGSGLGGSGLGGLGAANTEPVGSAVGPASGCGNGRLDEGEACDDGNAQPADGCEQDCTRSEVAEVAAGKDYTCVRSRAGHVRCWGRLGDHLCQPGVTGHIGDDEPPHAVPPLDFGASRRVRSVATGYHAGHVCAVLDDGTGRCWGSDGSGQLGLGPGIDDWCDDPGETLAALPPLALPPVLSLYPSELDTCALAGDDPERPGVYCWGGNTHGQLGLGDVQEREQPAPQPVDLGGALPRELSMGILGVCTRLDTGAVRCWGGNRNGQLGSGWPRDLYVGDGRGDGEHGQRPDTSDLDVRGLDGLEVAHVRANGGWTCIVAHSGVVRCWGGNDNGAMGYRYDQL